MNVMVLTHWSLPLDSETRMTTTTMRFSLYYVVRAREPALFWRENVLAVVTLLRVLARLSNKHVLNVSSFSSFFDREEA